MTFRELIARKKKVKKKISKRIPGNQNLGSADSMSSTGSGDAGTAESLEESPSYYRKIDDMLATSRIPITSKVAKLLGFETKTQDVYHVTSMEFLPALIKLQKTKNHISTFTKGLSNILHQISVKPDVLALLNGKVVMDFDYDIFSHPDKYGRRWLQTRGSDKSDFLQRALNKKTINKIIQYTGTSDTFDDLLYNDSLYRDLFNSLTKSQKTEIVQLYFDEVHRLLKNDIYKKIILDILSKNKRDTQYNELIVNEFTIKGVYALEAGKYQFNHFTAEDDISKLGVKYLGFLDRNKFKTI